MRRYKAYDPPEYHDWTADPDTIAGWNEQLQSDRFADEYKAVDPELIVRLYRGLLRARLYDIYLQRWVKQGVISKAWLATGEEAATIGAVHALQEQDVVGPMIRNAGACIEKGMPLVAMFSAYLATVENPTAGRDLHTGDLKHNIITPISHVAALVPVVAGAALSFKLDGVDRVALTWAGDGSTRCGEFHEGVNLAAAFEVPGIFVVQNNQVALGTHVSTHTKGPLSGLARAYGIPCIEVDGNHVLEVWAGTRKARRIAAAGQGPVMMVSNTFRMGGHATHDIREARKLFDKDTFAAWGKRDPIGCFEAWIEEYGPALGEAENDESRAEVNRRRMEEIEESVVEEMEVASAAALANRDQKNPDPATVADGVYA